MVPLEVNDQLASFILDTGATRSVVTEAAARRLALARDPWVGTTMSGIGGFNARPNANPRSLRLGGVTLVRRTVNHDTSLTVADFPSSESSGVPIDGLLGRDYLSLFDLDIDVPRRRLTLYQPLGCSGRFLPWTGPYVSVPVTQPVDTAMLVPVELDGVTLRGLLDTGANVSLIAAPGLHRLGLDPAEAEPGTHVPVTGVGPNTTPMAHRTFRTMRIGNVVIDHPTMLIAPIHLIPIADMLLGANWILSRRVWISYATRQVFVAAA
jgi:predicted aspartyl protease